VSVRAYDIKLSDYKKALKKLARYSVTIIPSVGLSNRGEWDIRYIYVGKSPDDIYRLSFSLGIPTYAIHGWKSKFGYCYYKLSKAEGTLLFQVFQGFRKPYNWGILFRYGLQLTKSYAYQKRLALTKIRKK